MVFDPSFHNITLKIQRIALKMAVLTVKIIRDTFLFNRNQYI